MLADHIQSCGQVFFRDVQPVCPQRFVEGSQTRGRGLFRDTDAAGPEPVAQGVPFLVLPGEGSAEAVQVLIEEIFRMARAWVDQRAGDPADGPVPSEDELVTPTPAACLDNAKLCVFCPARWLLTPRPCLVDPVQVFLERLRHAFPCG